MGGLLVVERWSWSPRSSKFSLCYVLSFAGMDVRMKPTSMMERVGLSLLQGGAVGVLGGKAWWEEMRGVGGSSG